MRLFSKIFISIVFLLSLFVVPAMAQQKESAIVFWGIGCPHCEKLKEDIAKDGLEKVIKIEYLEIFQETKYRALYDEKVAECKIDPQQAGVPLVYRNGKCALGDVDGLALLKEGFDASLLDSIKQPDAKVDDSNTTKPVDGKQNTLYLILGVVAIIVTAVAVGFVLEKKKNQANVLMFLLVLSTFSFFAVEKTYAICPVCTVAVGAGLGLSRYFGIDDVITSLWLGGLIMSTIFWTLGWFEKKGWTAKWITPVTYIGMILLVVVPLYFAKMFHPLNTLWGINKVLLGMIIGGIAFWLAAKLHFFLKKNNNDKVYFPFQKVIIPVSTLLLLTIIFYFIIY